MKRESIILMLSHPYTLVPAVIILPCTQVFPCPIQFYVEGVYYIQQSLCMILYFQMNVASKAPKEFTNDYRLQSRSQTLAKTLGWSGNETENEHVIWNFSVNPLPTFARGSELCLTRATCNIVSSPDTKFFAPCGLVEKQGLDTFTTKTGASLHVAVSKLG